MKVAPIVLFTVLSTTVAAEALGAWSLSNDQRRQYLQYYAPLIMKSAAETRALRWPGPDEAYWGADWITNFDFDRDGRFETNKANWEQIYRYMGNPASSPPVPPEFPDWKIRPTLYTSIIEFAEGSSKSVVLIYHVYHAKEQYQVHDWERIEIRVNNVNGSPGTGSEQIRYVVITRHNEHTLRLYPHEDLNFHQTPTGKHVMIWQAEWAENSGFYRAELHFVENTWATIAAWNAPGATSDADVEVNATSSKKDVHYVFVPDSDATAVSWWGAQTLTQANAYSLAAKRTGTFARWSEVKRIKYELQDFADIVPTGVNCASCGTQACVTEHGWATYQAHWEPGTRDVYLFDPIRSESLTTLVPDSSGCGHAFTVFLQALDVEDPNDKSYGYLRHSWFWGTYGMGWTSGGEDNDYSLKGGTNIHPSTGVSSTRPCAGGFVNNQEYWCQHDYFAHEGPASASALFWTQHREYGRWLPLNWHLDSNGGFDGRWVQLFPDNH